MNLHERHCTPLPRDHPALAGDELEALLAEVPGWAIENGELVRRFGFRNFHRTMAFVNAVAWVAHAEDHHPDLEVSYKVCRVRYRTHSIDGLSVNDFICAARIDALRGSPDPDTP